MDSFVRAVDHGSGVDEQILDVIIEGSVLERGRS